MANIIKTDRPKAPKKKRSLKKAGLIAAVLVFVAGVATGTYYLMQPHDEGDKDKASLDKERKSAHDSINEAALAASKASADGDSKSAMAAYDAGIEKASTPYERATLYYLKAMDLNDAGDKEAALRAALAAHEADTGEEMAKSIESLIANTAYDLGKDRQALDYYKRLRDRFKREGVEDIGNPLPAIEERIKELEAKVG